MVCNCSLASTIWSFNFKGQSCSPLEQPPDSNFSTPATREVRFGNHGMFHYILAFQCHKLRVFIGFQKTGKLMPNNDGKNVFTVLHIHGLGKSFFALGQKQLTQLLIN